jgi:hypothetical protein
MRFRLLSEFTNIEIIARGSGVDARHELNRQYGRANWRKLKGIATIEYEDGQIWIAELHWYEAQGIGQKRIKEKRRLERIA